MKPVYLETTSLGIVVHDLKRSLKRYVDQYGIGPWNVYEINSETVTDMTVDATPMEFRCRCAMTQFGNVTLELIEPLDEISDHGKFLKKHGEGIHHVGCRVDDYQEYLAFCEENGVPSILGGRWNGKLAFDYRDTRKDLKVLIAVCDFQERSELPKPLYVYPEDGLMPRDPVFNGLYQVGIVCDDAKATAKCYCDKYGFPGPWQTTFFSNKNTADMMSNGIRKDYTCTACVASLGSVQFELIEPTDTHSNYVLFRNAHGEGIQHLALMTPTSFDDAKAIFDKKGIPSIMGGHWKGDFYFNYRATQDDLGFIAELWGPEPHFTPAVSEWTYPEPKPQP